MLFAQRILSSLFRRENSQGVENGTRIQPKPEGSKSAQSLDYTLKGEHYEKPNEDGAM